MRIWPWMIMIPGIIATIALTFRRVQLLPPETVASKLGGPHRNRPDSLAGRNRQILSVTVSLLVLLSALFVILSGQYKESEQKWAFGVVGTLLGVVVRSER